MTSAFRDHSVSVRSLADPSLSLLRGTPRARCDVVGLSEEAEERAGVRLTQRAQMKWEVKGGEECCKMEQ